VNSVSVCALLLPHSERLHTHIRKASKKAHMHTHRHAHAHVHTISPLIMPFQNEPALEVYPHKRVRLHANILKIQVLPKPMSSPCVYEVFIFHTHPNTEMKEQGCAVFIHTTCHTNKSEHASQMAPYLLYSARLLPRALWPLVKAVHYTVNRVLFGTQTHGSHSY
jgi:hypothetical protein